MSVSSPSSKPSKRAKTDARRREPSARPVPAAAAAVLPPALPTPALLPRQRQRRSGEVWRTREHSPRETPRHKQSRSVQHSLPANVATESEDEMKRESLASTAGDRFFYYVVVVVCFWLRFFTILDLMHCVNNRYYDSRWHGRRRRRFIVSSFFDRP